MKAVAQTTVTPAQAMKMARQITASMVAVMCDRHENTYYARSRYDGTPGVRSGCDWTGANFEFYPVPGGMEFIGHTCGGHSHALRIFRNGTIEVEQAGARNSTGSIMFNYLPENWWDFSWNQKWELSEYETSRPDWSVVIALAGSNHRFGGDRSDSPTCLWEQEAWDHEHPAPIWEDDEFMSIPGGGVVGMGRHRVSA